MSGENEGNGAQTDRSNDKIHASAPIPAVVRDRIEEAENGQDHLAKDAKRRWLPREIKAVELIMIAFTAVTAVATWGGVYVAHSQLQAMRDQLAEMRGNSAQTDRVIALQVDANANAGYATALTDRLTRSAKTQAESSKVLAGTGRGQLATAQDTENRQLRAYLHVATRPPLHVAVGEVPQWGIEYSVLGQTPAYDAQVRQLVMLAPYPMPVDITRFYLATPFGPINKVAIFPGDHPWAMDSLTCISAAGKKIADCKLSQEAMTTLTNDPTTRLYVFGLVRYLDAFGAHHQTPFCFSRDPSDGTSQICPHLKAPD